MLQQHSTIVGRHHNNTCIRRMHCTVAGPGLLRSSAVPQRPPPLLLPCRRRQAGVVVAAAPDFDPPVGKREKRRPPGAKPGAPPPSSNPNTEQRLSKVRRACRVKGPCLCCCCFALRSLADTTHCTQPPSHDPPHRHLTKGPGLCRRGITPQV